MVGVGVSAVALYEISSNSCLRLFLYYFWGSLDFSPSIILEIFRFGQLLCFLCLLSLQESLLLACLSSSWLLARNLYFGGKSRFRVMAFAASAIPLLILLPIFLMNLVWHGVDGAQTLHFRIGLVGVSCRGDLRTWRVLGVVSHTAPLRVIDRVFAAQVSYAGAHQSYQARYPAHLLFVHQPEFAAGDYSVWCDVPGSELGCSCCVEPFSVCSGG